MKTKNLRGFTFLELLSVVAIMIILAALTFPKLLNFSDEYRGLSQNERVAKRMLEYLQEAQKIDFRANDLP